MRLKSREAWDEFLTRNYSKLLFTARKWTEEPRDLVHHTYLRCINKRYPSEEDENPFGYFIKAMYNEATRGQFKTIYQIIDAIPEEKETESDWTRAIQREQMQLILDRLSWFDRTIFGLYLQGWNMADLSRRTGIGESVLYRSIHESKKILKDVLRHRSKEE